MPKNRGEYGGHNSEYFKARPAQSHGSVAQRESRAPIYTECGRNHPRYCCNGDTVCFKCGQESHFIESSPRISKVVRPPKIFRVSRASHVSIILLTC